MATDKELVAKQARLERIRREARAQEERDRPQPELVVRRLSDVPDKKLVSAFGGRLVRGAFQLMVGPGEAGKGMSSASIIARFTTGEPFPGEDPEDKRNWRRPETVAVCVTEDAVERVKARLRAAGADLSRVVAIDGPPAMRGGLVFPSPIAFDDDAGAFLKRMRDEGATVLWLETTLEHLGDREGRTQRNTNNEAEVRRALAPIIAVCRGGDLIGWGVMHPRKSTDGGIADSISGSAAFRNVARGTLHVFEDPKDRGWRLLITSKANYLASRPPTLRFRIEKWEQDPAEGRVVWPTVGQGLIDDRSAEEVWRQIQEQNQKHRPRRDVRIEAAEKFLRTVLAGGMLHPDKVRELAEKEQHSWDTVNKAKVNIDVESVRAAGVFPAPVIGWRLPKEDM